MSKDICINGHDISVVGRTKQRRCRRCHHEDKVRREKRRADLERRVRELGIEVPE